MRIVSVNRRAISIFVFSIALAALNMANLNYFVNSGGVVNILDVVDIWANSHIEQVATSQTIISIENVDMKSLTGKIIVIDPGHGGIDNGALGHGHKEKDINLEIAIKLAQELHNNNASAVLTRAQDVDYYTKGKGGKRNDLLKRAQIIKESGAQIFISIHCNATGNSSWSGAQVFYNSQVAANKELAEIMQQSLKNFPLGNKRQAKQDSQIFLLKSINIPGVLIETGFISNKKEAGALGEEEYQKNIAKSIAKGLAYYFGNCGVR